MAINVAIDRRSLLIGSLTMLAARPFSAPAFAAGEAIAFVSASKHADGRYSVLLLSVDGAILRDVPLSARGHDIAIHGPSGRAVAFARRPGTFAVAFTTMTNAPPVVFAAAADRHFYGHGVFSLDGRLLYVSENDIRGARGVIGIYDVASNYKKSASIRVTALARTRSFCCPTARRSQSPTAASTRCLISIGSISIATPCSRP